MIYPRLVYRMENVDEQPKNIGPFAGLKRTLQRKKTALMLGFAGGASLVSTVAAETGETGVNWTEISDLIAGAAGIMPSVGVLIAAVAGILITLMIIGFVTGIFGAIIDTLRDITRFFR